MKNGSPWVQLGLQPWYRIKYNVYQTICVGKQCKIADFETDNEIPGRGQFILAKMTFDTCRAQIYCKSCDKDLAEYARCVKPFVSHVHVSDATGVGGEGIQIHNGEIVFNSLQGTQTQFVVVV